MATIVGTDGENILWIDEVFGLQSTPVNTAGLRAEIDNLQIRVTALESGLPPITQIDAGIF